MVSFEEISIGFDFPVQKQSNWLELQKMGVVDLFVHGEITVDVDECHERPIEQLNF